MNNTLKNEIILYEILIYWCFDWNNISNLILFANLIKLNLLLVVDNQTKIFGNKPVSPINSTQKSKSIRPFSIVRRLSTKGQEEFNNI